MDPPPNMTKGQIWVATKPDFNIGVACKKRKLTSRGDRTPFISQDTSLVFYLDPTNSERNNGSLVMTKKKIHFPIKTY